MHKTSIALTGAAALLIGTSAPPAAAEISNPAAVGDVRVAWATPAHEGVRVTWTESASAANTLTLYSSDPGAGPTELGTTPAGAANELVVTPARFRRSSDPAVKWWIVVSAADGGSARSVDFDMFTYRPSAVDLSFTADGQVRWTVPADTSTDGTPNDPLDLPTAYRYRVQQSVDTDPDYGNWECAVVRDLPPTTSRTGVVPSAQGLPYEVVVDAENEWGVQDGPGDFVGVTNPPSIAGPARTQYGATTTLTGQVFIRWLLVSGGPPSCDDRRTESVLDTVVVQQRTSSTAPWTVVGTTKTDLAGKYTAVVKNPGHREYRVVRPNKDNGESLSYGAVSGTTTVRATTRVVSAKFISPVISYGTRPQAYLWVDPAGAQRAALQFKNASGVWQGVSYKTLYAGRGLLSFPWNRRGVTQFRWWVPGTATADATYSGVFNLTVR
ncbi:hypothetical protein Kfla_1745 [Kribbella flavida DSM 17836]|uniref:Fibronectin type-III domain-containing protein n=1 Tax=Kribbella flavida (strain DSM 17836 / JCM 10339 / NBRC 14399) TaxID=479435 RepID=D2PNI8_KRIFD|nr:hypothetical protein [Kribbella flavida]ADB30840.1 hypothetical protein Kfla_1745 [Kribbella flavida DSM 17836]